MRTIFTALAALLVAGPALAQGVEGVWQTEANDEGRYLQIRIGPCETDPGQVCGIIDGAFNGASEANVGKLMIWDMVPVGPNEWDDGTIWKPDDDEEYDSEMELRSDGILEVSGCIFFGQICKSQDWTRVE